MIDPGTYTYYNTCWQADLNPPVFRPGEYSTDIVSGTAIGYLEAASQNDRPFFLGIAPIAPHSQAVFPTPSTYYFDPPVPAKRHEGLFLDAKVPRTSSFNPVQATDELVGAVIDKVTELGIADNTYIIYTSDNGFHIGQHRLQPGKTCMFEEDINVPFFVRGPDIPKNHTVKFATSHTDIAPTIFTLAQIPLRADFDGTPIPLTVSAMAQAAQSPMHDHVTIEYWGAGAGEGIFARNGPNGSFTSWPNNTYKAMRIISPKYDLFYSVWCTNEHELYDMKTDPYQTNNLYDISGSFYGHSIDQVTARLDALLMVLKSCKNKQCTQPWLTIHPGGQVHNLAEALENNFDNFYATQPRISFTKCELGYIPLSEGAMDVVPWHLGD
ncbi:hypothetical protein LTS17_009186 [Exophiala oligosperma]